MKRMISRTMTLLALTVFTIVTVSFLRTPEKVLAVGEACGKVEIVAVEGGGRAAGCAEDVACPAGMECQPPEVAKAGAACACQKA